MTTKKSKGGKNKKVRDPNRLEVVLKPNEKEEDVFARTVLQPAVSAGTTIQKLSRSNFGEVDLTSLIKELNAQVDIVNEGDLKHTEAMLVAQSHTLNSIFNKLAIQALNCDLLDQFETLFKLALKAQSQCRTTLETLATIKNPPIMGYVKQANIANGPQQVNNGIPVRENEYPQNKLLEKNHGKRLDYGATSKTSIADPAMATVGKIDRPKNIKGKS